MGTQLPQRSTASNFQFLAHVCCGQTAGWIKMPLCTEIDQDGDLVMPLGATEHNNKSLAVAEMGDRRQTWEEKRECCCAPFAGELGPRLTPCGLGRGLLPYQVASSSIQPFCHNRHRLKTGRCAPFRGGSWAPV